MQYANHFYGHIIWDRHTRHNFRPFKDSLPQPLFLKSVPALFFGKMLSQDVAETAEGAPTMCRVLKVVVKPIIINRSNEVLHLIIRLVR